MKKLLNVLFWQKLVWVTQTINVWILQGNPDESTSSHCYRKRDYKYVGPLFTKLYKAIDFVLRDPQHCRKAYLAELEKTASWEKHSGN